MTHSRHLATVLSRSYPWVTAPFLVSAPMRVMAGPALAVSVSQAGGLGFLGPGVKTQDLLADLQDTSDRIKALPQRVSFSERSLLPVGVGFQLWSDDLDIAITAIERFKPCAAWLYAPREGPGEYDVWSRRIRTVSAQTQIWIQIGTLAEARELLHSQELPDVIVVQGAEAGGHGRAHDGLGLITLLPEVADLVAGRVPLFAAGGIADGRGAAAALCLGASGVVMGTRFLASEEARISGGYQQEIIRASDGAASTTRTLLYNHLRGTMGWPSHYSPRTITNRSFVEHQQGRPFAELKALHDEALKAGDQGWGPAGRLATYAGASIGLIHEVKSAATTVREIQEEVRAKLPSL
ncbi:nitronate monooxygenase [Aspergillus homomorphus CBS 101889]|uniref:Putative oxidoreductase 2-nitropropane dioxygenase family n=1 Tax=Aspergillus homomorphus (strain CBS 101889) TaxID=1450537 RepID=A0A395HYX0_ASPHC|nr:putative oxidoreductase 2-nitropropane dioxygenase family [Aspergillus homomorphus CBS 101889]RAL12583.1 putative oxidoreductase 2-nitropropane dioxygenase family [Aspergillus homomorphus CBS 101889]